MAKITAGPAPWSRRGRGSILVNRGDFSNVKGGFGGGNRGLVNVPSKELKNSATGDPYKVYKKYCMPEGDFEHLSSLIETAHGAKTVKRSHNEVENVLSDRYKDSIEKDGKHILANVRSAGDYIDYGFGESQQKNITSVECKGGHIASIAYNPGYKLLKVLFAKRGDEVVFFDLPANVAATLMYLGANGTMAPPDKNGRERHAVGVEFWNLVRIRGTLHGTRYRFSYTVDNRTGFSGYGGTTGGTPAESGDGGNMSSSEAETVANVTQENKPYSPVTEIPEPAKFPSYALDEYGKADFDRILGEDGIYRPWYDEMKRSWQASGASYMLRLADKAEKSYKSGNIGSAIEAFKDLSRSGVKFPDAMENDVDFDFSEAT